MPLPALHRRNQRAVDKTRMAPPICHCEEAAGRRGALSAKREEVPLGCNLGEALPNCTGHCRGAACRSRRCTNDWNNVPLKRHAPIASVAALSERHAHPRNTERPRRPHAPCRGRAVPSRRCTGVISGPSIKRGWPPPDLSLRGGRRPTWRPEREARGSALGVQSRGGSCDFADGFPVIRPGTARLPRRFAPRNDTSGRRSNGNGAAHRIGGTTAASRTGGACPAPTGPVRI